jgi:hypothetical protein
MASGHTRSNAVSRRLLRTIDRALWPLNYQLISALSIVLSRRRLCSLPPAASVARSACEVTALKLSAKPWLSRTQLVR